MTKKAASIHELIEHPDFDKAFAEAVNEQKQYLGGLVDALENDPALRAMMKAMGGDDFDADSLAAAGRELLKK